VSGPKGESGIKGNKNEKRGKPLAFIRDLIDRYYAHDVARDGAALTYYLLFAIFPLLVFVSTLVGLMDLDIEETLTAMSRILPEQVLGIVGSYLEYVSTSPSRQLLVFSLIFSVWFPLRATSCLMHSVRKAYGVPQPPSMIGGTLRNLIFTLWLIVTIAASIVLTTVGRRALQFVSGLIHIPDQFINVWETLRFAVLGVIMLLVLVPLNMLARGRRCPLREVVPGVLLSMLAWLALSVAFSYYVEKVAHYTELYGSIATIVVVLLWLYMTGQVLIMGAEYNGSRLAYRENKTIHPPEGEKGTKCSGRYVHRGQRRIHPGLEGGRRPKCRPGHRRNEPGRYEPFVLLYCQEAGRGPHHRPGAQPGVPPGCGHAEKRDRPGHGYKS